MRSLVYTSEEALHTHLHTHLTGFAPVQRNKSSSFRSQNVHCLFSLFFISSSFVTKVLLKVLFEQIWLDWIWWHWAAPLCMLGESRALFCFISQLAWWNSGHKLVYAYLLICNNVWFLKPMAWIHYSMIKKESSTETSLGFYRHAMFLLFIYRWNYPCWLKLQSRHQTQ